MVNQALKIVLWCGNAPNQRALANKLASRFNLVGIVIDRGVAAPAKRKWQQLPSIIFDRLRFRTIYNAWKNLLRWYDQRYPDWPAVDILEVKGINQQDTVDFTQSHQADLVMVSGTGLVKEPAIHTTARLGIINLHTGLSPFVKGGPNCTNWCIANNSFHLVGNTIMWLNKGIDAGNLISTETVDIKAAKDLDEAHRQVMEHAHDLYLRVVEYLSNNQPPYISVPQKELGAGNLYLTRMWTASMRSKLMRNWRNRKNFQSPPAPKTVSIV